MIFYPAQTNADNLKLNDLLIPYIIQYLQGHPLCTRPMSTIRAKQQICLNVCTIRAFNAYSPGRYCLRFFLWETYNNGNNAESPSEHRYAVPVSVIQYKSNSSPTSATSPQSDISEYYYQTKPFMLKTGSEVQIHEICVFKHDINIFNSKYETDYHEITMKCKCELISYDYSGEESRVISTFNGRIRGVGISDSLVIDFWEGISCQVIGTVHNCVYQFQYVYTQSGRPDSVMKESINIENINQMMGHAPNSKDYPHREAETINFQKYCSLQSKQYVESLLEYLISQVNKSDEKLRISLDAFNLISDKSKKQTGRLELSPQREEEYSIELQRSIRTQSLLEAESIIDKEMKQRLSILKAQSQYYCPADDDVQLFIDEQDVDDMNAKQEKQNRSNQDTKNNLKRINSQKDQEDYVCIVLESDQEQVQQQIPKSWNHHKLENANGNESRTIKKKERIFGAYVRDQAEQRIDKNVEIKKQNTAKVEKSQREAQQRDKNKITRRRKIFVHSNTSVSGKKDMNQQLVTQLQQVKLINKSSVYEARFIPSSGTHSHPNHQIQNQSKKSTSKVTIQEFERILHGSCLNIYQKWRKFLAYLAEPQGILLVNAYKLEYRKKLEALLGQSVIRFKGSLDIDIYSKEESQRNKMAYQIRSQVADNERNILINQFRFYNRNLFSAKKPIFFEEKFEQLTQNQIQNQVKHQSKKSFIKVSLSSNTGNQSEISHVVFLVHGLGACRLDMDRLKIEIRRNFKEKVHVVCSCSNEGRTEGNIDQMGVRLGHEVQQEIAKNFGNYQNLQNKGLKISFVGHSMGGIIIRSALPRLEKFKNFFHSFVTLSSPHLGYCYSSSKLIDVGLWLINNWQKCQSILQLTMSDVSKNSNPKSKFNLEDTFLYKLSLQKGLEWFKKITFLASRQDLYVPYFSARVQKHEECINDLKYNNQYAVAHSKMVDNILGRVRGNVTRIDVNFCITQQNIDNLIGRAAHINFVNSVDFLQLLCVADEGTLI